MRNNIGTFSPTEARMPDTPPFRFPLGAQVRWPLADTHRYTIVQRRRWERGTQPDTADYLVRREGDAEGRAYWARESELVDAKEDSNGA